MSHGSERSRLYKSSIPSSPALRRTDVPLLRLVGTDWGPEVFTLRLCAPYLHSRHTEQMIPYYASKIVFQYFVDNSALKTNPATGVKYPFVNDTRGRTQTI